MMKIEINKYDFISLYKNSKICGFNTKTRKWGLNINGGNYGLFPSNIYAPNINGYEWKNILSFSDIVFLHKTLNTPNISQNDYMRYGGDIMNGYVSYLLGFTESDKPIDINYVNSSISEEKYSSYININVFLQNNIDNIGYYDNAIPESFEESNSHTYGAIFRMHDSIESNIIILNDIHGNKVYTDLIDTLGVETPIECKKIVENWFTDSKISEYKKYREPYYTSNFSLETLSQNNILLSKEISKIEVKDNEGNLITTENCGFDDNFEFDDKYKISYVDLGNKDNIDDVKYGIHYVDDFSTYRKLSNGTTIIETKGRYTANGIINDSNNSDNGFDAYPLLKQDYTIGYVDLPKINSDVYIDRGFYSVFELHYKLNDMKNVDDISTKNNILFNIINE